MMHGMCVLSEQLYNAWAMGWIYVVQPMMHGCIICCTAHVAWEVNPSRCVVQSIVHGVYNLLYSPWCMEQTLCCTIHGAWVYNLLYNPWCMGCVICCTTLGAWGADTIVQSMRHGAYVLTPLLYSPWFMRNICYCTFHGLWERYIPVQPMIHEKYIL